MWFGGLSNKHIFLRIVLANIQLSTQFSLTFLCQNEFPGTFLKSSCHLDIKTVQFFEKWPKNAGVIRENLNSFIKFLANFQLQTQLNLTFFGQNEFPGTVLESSGCGDFKTVQYFWNWPKNAWVIQEKLIRV